jgi:hypothetical protein
VENPPVNSSPFSSSDSIKSDPSLRSSISPPVDHDTEGLLLFSFSEAASGCADWRTRRRKTIDRRIEICALFLPIAIAIEQKTQHCHRELEERTGVESRLQSVSEFFGGESVLCLELGRFQKNKERERVCVVFGIWIVD